MDSQLTSLLEEEAAQEKAMILQKAREEVNALLSKVNEEADEKLRKAEEEIALWRRREKEKAQSALNLQFSSSLLKEKSTWIQKVFSEAGQKLEGYGANPDYPKIMGLLLEEALPKNQTEEIMIVVHPDDQALLQNLLAERKIKAKIKTDSSIKAGLKLISEEGKIEVSNILGDRLKKAEAQLLVKVRKILWEE